MTEKAVFFRDGMSGSEIIESIIRYNAREARVFDHSNDTIVVTRKLLLSAADEIERLRGMVKEAIGWLDGEGLYRQADSLKRDLSATADEEQS